MEGDDGRGWMEGVEGQKGVVIGRVMARRMGQMELDAVCRSSARRGEMQTNCFLLRLTIP